MLIAVPYKTNIKGKAIPWMNYVFIGINILVFLYIRLSVDEKFVALFGLNGWTAAGIFGYMWVHIGFVHLLMNMLYLWVFGNALCSGVGNIKYCFLYIFGGVIAAIGYLLVDGRPAIGSSGANNAVIVSLCMLYPFRNIKSTILFIIIPVYYFSLAGMWFLLIKFLYDLLFSFVGFGKVAYFIHLFGLIGGGVLSYILIKAGILKSENTNKDAIKTLWTGID